MSDDLRLCCSIENEAARNATKKFACILQKAFKQYHDLMEEHIKLLSLHGKDADIGTLLHLSDINEYINDGLTNAAKGTKPTISAVEDISKASDLTSSFDDTVTRCNKFMNEKTESNTLSMSPVLVKKRLKSKKSNSFNNTSLGSTPESDMCEAMKENVPDKKDSVQNDSTKIDKQLDKNKCSLATESYNNNDEIQCTPTSKVPAKLGISKLYNVETTLLQNGKKSRQSKLVLLPDERKTNIMIDETHGDLKLLKKSTSFTSGKGMFQGMEDIDQTKHIDEEIIESSPKSVERRSKMKTHLKMKKKSPRKSIKRSFTNDNRKTSNGSHKRKHNDMKANMQLKETNMTSLGQYSPPIYTSTQNDSKPYLIRSEAFCISSSGNKTKASLDYLNSPPSPDLLSNEQVAFGIGSSEVQESNKLKAMESCSQTQKRKYSELSNASMTCNDETFFAIDEKSNKKNNCYSPLLDSVENVSEAYLTLKTESVKRSLMSSFDIVPKKDKDNDLLNKPSRRKSERAKMTGVTCWECKKYYEGLGLPEEQIKFRQDQCSRHRTNYKKRESSPEGMWDPLFPDTASSTFQDSS